MEHLQSLFMEEAGELLHDLERGLLKLETNAADADGIAMVFRCMHTLKGSARMFGFEGINTLTHQLESIYQDIREGHQSLTPATLEITYRCLDHLGKLLHDPMVIRVSLQEEQAHLLQEIGKLCIVNTSFPVVTSVEHAGKKDMAASLWYISFIPAESILRHGTNTLYLIDDLLAMGGGMSLPYFINKAEWETLDATRNYTAFEIVLESSCTEADIQEIFLFVQSECELVIRSFPTNGFSFSEQVRQQVWQKHDINMPIGYAALSALLAPNANLPNDLQRSQPNGKSSVRVPAGRLDDLMNLVSELVTTQARLSLFATQSQGSELLIISENVEKITRRLRDNAFSMSLIPVESLVVRFQRLIRDLSKELDKEVLFKTEGTETEIDKSIIEKLTDPVLHLLRNALDHGIESPDKREQQNKPRQGTVVLKAYYSGTSVVIEISDDGAGINLNKVKQKAIATGIIAESDSLKEEELIQLIFHPGFSTAEQVTGISGRGVGMDVVKRNINDIQGEIEIQSTQGVGTTFVIRLPLTLSIIDGLLVRTGKTSFLLPMSAVRKCYEVHTRLLDNYTHQQVVLDDQRIPVFNLCKVFTPDEPVPERSQVITVLCNKKTFGLAVESIIGEYQAVLKPLGSSYLHQDEFSGATILGDGTVALVIDPNKLIRNLIRNEEIVMEVSNPNNLKANEI